MVLAFCKGLALAMVSKNRSITRLLDSTVEMLADSFAEFVIRQGGWVSFVAAWINVKQRCTLYILESWVVKVS